MTIVAIPVANEGSPTEVQTWVNANATATVIAMCVWNNIFYILTK